MAELDRILGDVAQGKDVVFIGADGSVFKIDALPRTRQPVYGSTRGLVQIGPDFDALIKGFEDAVKLSPTS